VLRTGYLGNRTSACAHVALPDRRYCTVDDQQRIAQRERAARQHTNIRHDGGRPDGAGIEEVIRRTPTYVIEYNKGQREVRRRIGQPCHRLLTCA
jgi:hypothetical protein